MSNLDQQTLESMSQAVWYNDWIIKKFAKLLHGDILEIGCGIGNFTDLLAKYGSVWAIDIDKEYVKETEQKVMGKAQVGIGDIEAGKYFFGNRQFNSIVCLNVLEHIEDDNRALKNLFKLLKNGGRLILIIPSHQFLYGAIDKSINHYRRYDKSKLNKQLEKIGFKIQYLRRLNFLGALGWFVVGKILKEGMVRARSVKIFNLIAPFFLSFENLIETPIGTSLLVVAEKQK